MVPFDEAPLLLATLSSKLGVRLPLLVQAGILQHTASV
ncbi:hypothetical protein HaLaN_10728 [Haematococcus lacustris]|uniref:Uncharacterized protein n=1 Tax=Haematococcus lacustris TaxID=44745 RepID=A0A699ZGA5_HAELA|nr:hypothetical protein HaLaN_10728 [Haematococcus lacustris]